MMKTLRIFLILCCTALMSFAVLGQSSTATLSGTVTDQSGAVVAGANLKVTNSATGIERQTVTNAQGYFAIPLLPPSNYTVSVSRTGFATTEINNVVLNVSDLRSLQIQLKVGQVGESVQVDTNEIPLINDNPGVSTTVDRNLVDSIPLPGRSFQGVIALSPGVVITETNSSDQGQFSVNGQRRSSNGYFIDGVSANFGGANGANLGQSGSGSLPAFSAQGGTNSLVSVDALQELTIQTSTYAAEYGRQPGAQISILTRSGTNKFSGSVFEYFRNDKLDANDWFNNRLNLKKPALRQNQFGGVFGGPLYLPRFGQGGPGIYNGKDRTFFFFSYEGLRLLQPQTRNTEVPSLTARQSVPAALRPFFNAYPLPNGPVSATDPNVAQFKASFSDPSDLNTYSLRLDHFINKKLQIFGRFNDSGGETQSRASSAEGTAASVVTNVKFKTRTLTLGAISTLTDSMVNDFRFNYSTNRISSNYVLDNYGGAVPFQVSDLFATPQNYNEENGLFFFLNLSQVQSVLTLGKNADNIQRQINIVDHISIVKGSHNLKFGFDYRRLSPSFSPRDYNASGFFLDFTTAIFNLPFATNIQQSRSGSFYFNNFGFYAQDTWKATPRLVVSYGLRWDIDLTPTLGDGLQPLAATKAGFTDPTQLALAPAGTPLYKTSYNNFAPRLGLVYQLRQNPGSETILRGGFGVFYDLVSQYAGQIAQVSYPPFGSSRLTFGPLLGGPATFPFNAQQAVLPVITSTPPFTASLTFFNPELKSPYSLQWNVGVEQSLGTNQTISVSYVASRGYRLLQQEQISGQVNPNFVSPVFIDTIADSQYDSMQMQFQRRLSKGLQALAAYTWAHSIDTASTAGFSATNNFSRSRPDGNRADSDFDIRHAFNAAVSYQLPSPSQNKTVKAFLGGWSIDAIATARTAPPLTIMTTGLTPPLESAAIRPDIVSGVPLYLFGSQYPGGKAINPNAFVRPPTQIVNNVRRVTRQGTAGRNAFRGFGAMQLDLALRREFKLGENVRLQLRGEMFNIFNHPNFGAVNTTLAFNETTGLPTPSAVFGQSTSMLGRSLGQGGVAGGFSPLFQIGGPRSTQLSIKFVF